MAAAAATFGSGPDLSHDPAAGNPNVYTTFTVAVTSTDDPTATATSTPGTSVATSATFVTATASTATAEHVGGFQFVDGDEAMYLGPIDHDFIKAQFVTITSTSVALAGDRAFVVHDILISGKALDAVPRHRLRRLGKMPASVVKKARAQAKKLASERKRSAIAHNAVCATALCAGDEVLFFGPKDASYKTPKLAVILSDSTLTVNDDGTDVLYDIALSGTGAAVANVHVCCLQDVLIAEPGDVKRARANAKRAQNKAKRIAALRTASTEPADGDENATSTEKAQLQTETPQVASFTPSPARLAEIGAAAAQDMEDIRDRVPCAVCYCSVKATDTSPTLVNEHPPPKWLSKLKVLQRMNLHAELRTQYQLQDDDADVHPQWLDMLLCPDSMYSSGHGEWSIDVCDVCRRSLNGTSKNPPKNSIANGNYRGFATKIPEIAALKAHELDLLRRAITRQVTKVQLSFTGNPDAVRCTAKTSVSMRKLATEEYRDVLNGISTPTVSTHVCLGNVNPTAAGVQAAIDRRIFLAKVRVREYTAAHDKLKTIKPSFDQPVAADLNLTDNLVPKGTLVFSFTNPNHQPENTHGTTPETVADSAGIQINGRATMIVGDADTASAHGQAEVLLSANGFESMWNELGHFRAFPDVYPFDRGGPKEERPVAMSWQAHASLLIRCWDRTAARNQTWILVVYDTIVKTSASRDCMSAATRAAGDNPASAVQVTVSREELRAATNHHEAKHNALRAGKPLPPRPTALSASAEQMLRSLTRSTRLIPGTTEHALNRRNQFWALNVFIGGFSHWNTTSQSDATDDAITDIAVGKDNHDRSPDTVLTTNAEDPGACVMYYSELVNVYVHRILGWDRASQKSVLDGGVFGEIAGFAGSTEDQTRKSLHLHSLATTKAFPKTAASMLKFLVEPANVRNLVHHMDTVQTQRHPCHTHEFTNVGDLGHLCPPTQPGGSPNVTQTPATIKNVPAGYRAVSKVLKLDYPKIVLCECGEAETAQSMVRAWALNACDNDVRDSYLGGNVRLSGFKVDFDLLLLPPPPATSGDRFDWDIKNAKERAKLTLIGINVMEHKPGHMRSCFKHTNSSSGSTSKRPTCRFRLPAVPCAHSAVVINGKVVCDCVGPCTTETHLQLSATFTLSDVNTMELRVHRPAGFEYTNNHNIIELAVFRMNTDTTVTLGRPGMVYYVTTYATKLPETSSSASAIMLAYDRAVAKEGLLVQTPRQILNSRTASYLHACTRVQEVSVTMAAKYLLDGSLHYSSHSFEHIYVHNIVAFYDKTGFTVTMVPANEGAQGASRQTGYKAAVPQFLDYVLRDNEVLPDIDYYDFVSTHTRVKAVYDPDNPGRHLPLHDSHPLHKTHCITVRRHPVVPQMVGTRLPNKNTLDTADSDTVAVYKKTILALHKPHSSTRPPWGDTNPIDDAHAAWIPSATASVRLSRHQDYHDQRTQARNSAKMRAAVQQTVPDHDQQGMLFDDFDDGGAEMMSAMALEAIGGAPPTRSMPATLREHLLMVEAAVTARTATMCSQDATFDEDCLSVANAAPPTAAAWEPVPASHINAGTTASDGNANVGESVPRALLVSSALTSAAEASAANPRSAAAAIVALTHPTLAAVSREFRLNVEQQAAFQTACLPLLAFFLDLADDRSSPDFVRAEAQLATRASGTNQMTLAVMGEGGTGKSEVIKAISYFASAWGLRRHVSITAPTGSAAILVDGCTLHSWAGIGIRGTLSKRNLSAAQLADDPVNCTVLLIIDEVSLVSAELMGLLSNTLKRKRNSNKPFGGLSVVFSGDMYQLKPVQGTPLFDTSAQADNAGTHAQAGFDVWRSLSHVVMLKTNYRAAKDPEFMALLRRLRNHAITSGDIETLQACRVSHNHMPPIDAATAWYANKDVNATNSATVMYAAALSKKRTYRLSASVRASMHEPPIPTTGPAHSGYVVGSRKGKRNDLPISHIDVYLGCPVTIYVNNKLTQHKIAKGSRGIVIGTHPPLNTLVAANAAPTQVTLPNGSTHDVYTVETLPEYIIVKVPDSTVQFAGLPVGAFPVGVKREKLLVHGHEQKMAVSQFPLRLNFAWTCHKLQGKTEPHLILGTTNKILNFNYTALSRVRSLSELFILKGVKLSLRTLNCSSPNYTMLVHDMNRLSLLSADTIENLQTNVTLQPAVQPAVANADGAHQGRVDVPATITDDDHHAVAMLTSDVPSPSCSRSIDQCPATGDTAAPATMCDRHLSTTPFDGHAQQQHASNAQPAEPIRTARLPNCPTARRPSAANNSNGKAPMRVRHLDADSDAGTLAASAKQQRRRPQLGRTQKKKKNKKQSSSSKPVTFRTHPKKPKHTSTRNAST